MSGITKLALGMVIFCLGFAVFDFANGLDAFGYFMLGLVVINGINFYRGLKLDREWRR